MHLVGGELRAETGERVRDTRARGDEQCGRVAAKPDEIRRDDDCRQHGQDHNECDAAAVLRRVGRCSPAEPGEPERDREDTHDLVRTDVLAKRARAKDQQEDERRRERRLDQRQRRKRERDRLQHPAENPGNRPGEPQRPANQAAEEREAERVFPRGLARFDGLQADGEAVERGGRERDQNAGEVLVHRSATPAAAASLAC